MKVEVKSPVKRTGRVMQVEGMFDVPQNEEQTLTIEVPEAVELMDQLPERPWGVGLVVGPSGAGKSTVAQRLWPNSLEAKREWSATKAIVDDFPKAMSVKDVVGALTAVGLGSPPAWLRPYRTLSTGEKFRADVARALCADTDPIVIDEFTSTVDRQVAKVSSHAVQKAVRRSNKRLIAVTCHHDVIEWLQPDWVYRPDTVDFEWRRLQRHPAVELRITTLPHSAWKPFSRYHYLSHVLHGAAKCFGAFIGDECVAFNSYIPFPHPSRKNIRMGHRLVVLPDYQGLGIGGRFDDWLGLYLYERGYRYHKTISHPALISYYSRSPRWELMKGANRPTRGGAKRLQKTMQNSRKLATRSFRYLPPKNS